MSLFQKFLVEVPRQIGGISRVVSSGGAETNQWNSTLSETSVHLTSILLVSIIVVER